MEPTSVAVVGATDRPGSVRPSVYRNILYAGYRGVLVPVNPRLPSVQGVKAYPRLADIPDRVDMAVIIVPSIIEEAAPKGRQLAIVTNAGGPGITATDTAIRHGLQLARLVSDPPEIAELDINPMIVYLSTHDQRKE